MKLIGVLLAVLLGLTACSESGPEVTGTVERYPESLLTELLDIDDGSDPARPVAVETAGRCLLAEGFDVDPHLIFQTSARFPTEVVEAATSLTDVEFAEQFGFGIAESSRSSLTELRVDPLQEYVSTLPPAEGDAFRSVLHESCMPAAIAAEQADPSFVARSLFGLYSQEIQEAVDADPEQVDLVRQWSACMSGLGYQYQSLHDVRNAAMDRVQLWMYEGVDYESVEAQEIREAVDSLSCEAPLRPQFIEVRARVERQWIEAHPELG